MIAALRRLARLALGPLLLAGCAAQEAPPAPEASGPVPVGIRLTLSGDTGPVLGDDNTGSIALTRQGADEPVSLSFENGALAVHDLAPGQYQIAALGPLACRGLAFEVGAAPRYLGAVDARLVDAEYLVALMSRPRVAEPDVVAVAGEAETSPQAVDARPIQLVETAPCSLGPGPGTTWDNLTVGEKILLTISLAGFCAIAVASGGFCAF